MRHLNKIASVLSIAALGLLAMTSCEGGDLYSVDAPDWISEKVDSINNAKQPVEEPVIEGLEEDVYTIGTEDFTAPFFTLGKTYVVPAGEIWQAQFNLTVNPDNKYFKNFFIVLNHYVDGLGDEYGVIRFDNDPTKNSEWNTTGTCIDRSLIGGNFTNSSGADDIDTSVQKMNGKITLTVDRSNGGLFIKMTNGVLEKTYTQTTPFPTAETSGDDLACRIGVEGSLVNFLASTIEPIGGFTSADDKLPVSMELIGVPDEVPVGSTLEDVVAGITANVYFESVPTPKTVTAEELTFQAIPDMENPGEKTLIAVYNKTFKGENADTPVMAYANFKLVLEIVSIEVLKEPVHKNYSFYNDPVVLAGVERTLLFDPTGMEVQATYSDGTTGIVNNARILADPLPTIPGTYDVTISTDNGKSAIITGITVAESEVTLVHPTPTILGAEDNTSGWWSVHSDNILVPSGATYQVNFTNYSSGAGNWNNYVIVLRSADNLTEYAVVRADNYGWGGGYDGNANLLNSGGQADWAAWLAAMNGAQCSAYITNIGNGTADIQVVMNGTDGNTYIQYYVGICTVNPDDCNFAFTVDGSHYVFE